jgi:hypothetical protein
MAQQATSSSKAAADNNADVIVICKATGGTPVNMVAPCGPQGLGLVNIKQNKEKKVTIAIIGSAGRKDDASKMKATFFRQMCDSSKKIIVDEWKMVNPPPHLVSGGSAWSDHVAVRLFIDSALHHLATSSKEDKEIIRVSGLTLHLPCDFEMDSKNPRFKDTGSSSWMTNPGRYLNELHKKFSQVCGISSLVDIFTALKLGATCTVSSGFHARNALVAQSQFVLAWTWSSTQVPQDGGTLHTWNLAKKATKRHVSFDSLKRETLVHALFL